MSKSYIVSQEFPNGLSWFLNILLELSIKTHRSEEKDFWVPQGSKYTLHPSQEEIKRWLPFLSKSPQASFSAPVSFQWVHVWPRPDLVEKPAVFYIRNGLDAVHSQYKRHTAGLSFLTYLRSPFRTTPGISPTILHLSAQDTWGFYNLIWKRFTPKDSLWFHFEQMKKDPIPDLQKVLKKYGLTKTDSEIQKAIEESTFDKAKAAEDLFIQNNPNSTGVRINRSGKVGEWKQVFGPKERACFAGLAAQALKEFGYEKEYQEVLESPTVDFENQERLIQYIETIKSQRTVPSVESLQGKLTPAETLSLARIVSSKKWFEELTGKKAEGQLDAFHHKLYYEIADVSRYVAPTALNLAIFAKHLALDGYKIPAIQMLSAFIKPSEVSFFEAMQLSRVYRLLGVRKQSKHWLQSAARLLEGTGSARYYAWELVEEKDYAGAWTFLRTAKKPGWTVLVARHFLRQVQARVA